MLSKGLENAARMLVGATAASLICSGALQADDTEIYQATPTAVNSRPQVLIIFDDSGSMNDVVVDRAPYDPDATYIGSHPADRVYWSTDGEPPAENSPGAFILATSNRCATSIDPLAQQGFFPTNVARWFEGGREEVCFIIGGNLQCVPNLFESPAGWKALEDGKIVPAHLECEADVINNNPLNPGTDPGYPQNTSTDGLEYGPIPDLSLDWGEPFVLFSANYMNWYYDDTFVITSSTKLEIAQEAVVSLVEANAAVDFGLALFNDNSGDGQDDEYDGGRIVQRLIPDMTDGVEGDRASLTAILNGTIAAGFTPLCETTMEVFRYLAGEDLTYGAERDPANDLQPKDDLAENPAGVYSAPLNDCANTYIILMTDGRPTYDQDANADIEALTGETCESYPNGFDAGALEKNCLPDLAGYMSSNDIDQDDSNGQQLAYTYTIGYGLGEDEALLSDTANEGGGEYYPAGNAKELAAAFRKAILDILSDDTTFTSPAVAVDTFTRTQSRNEVFFAMFTPDNHVNWPGNIKRLDIDLSTGSAVLVDESRNPGNPAIDASTGRIRSNATTFWTVGGADGPDVTKGGVGALLKARDPASRTLYSNTGLNDTLEPYAAENFTAAAFGFDDNVALYRFFDVADEDEFHAALDWGEGYDLSDEDGDQSTNDTRWILADMLHSKPLVVNYGARTGDFSREVPDLRIVVGTNSGFLHMFGNVDGEEDWAFFAKELAPVLNERLANAVSSDHVYGIDAPSVLYTLDRNKDGNLISTGDADTSDKAYLYFGLRRGGRIFYALDISEPDDPELLWRIDNRTQGFGMLGQTWSVPVVTLIPGYRDDDGIPKPVLVFGGGYDTNKDSAGVATEDAIGRGVFIVDAQTGELVWSVTPAADSATNMQEIRLRHSVAATVNVLDSNGDELTDRIYFADTGGNLWRVDLPGSTLPDANQDSWRVVKVAIVNGGTKQTDRRFFNAPDIVRTSYAGLAFDAILIGSGDRTNPNDVDNPDDPNDPAVDNQFYMFRDLAINPYFTAAPADGECDVDPAVDFRCRLPLRPSDLYDVTANDIENGSAAEQAVAGAALLLADGWRLDLQADGEKALARSLTIGGKVYFTTFEPASVAANVCAPIAGTGRLYVIDLITAVAEEDFDSNGNTDRSWIIGEILPDTPSPHFGSDGEIRLLLPPGSGGGTINSPFLTGASIPSPYGSYWYQEEY